MSEDFLFAGLRVLDVGSWIAAPVATTMLADFGAQVIKIEVPGAGDGYRRFSASAGAPDSEVNYCWQMDARNKRSLSLNLNSEQGLSILQQLIAQADVYVTNHTPRLRERWGLTHAELMAAHPRLIYAALTAYGEAGEERNREAFDLVAYWSRSGLMDLVRAPGADPAPALPGMGDHPTAVAMYAGILTALLRRQQTGKGSFVHTSLLANGIWSASCIAQAAFVDSSFERYRAMMGHLFTRVMYAAADGRWLQFTMVRTEAELDAMFAVLGVPELLLDERFSDPETRLLKGDELVRILRPLLRARDSGYWLQQFHQAGVPAALVGEVTGLPGDPQVAANNMVADPGDTGLRGLVKHPVNVHGLPTATPSKAPEVGEHSRQILQELGYDEDAISRFSSDGVI